MIDFFSLEERNSEFADQILNATKEVLAESRFINGSHVEKFESEFADYLSVAHVVGVANGLDAITLALLALDIGPGDEVIVPGFTFIATWLAVSRVGATIIPVDVKLQSANIDFEKILVSLTDRTKAVIVVNLYGRPALTPKEVSIIQSKGIRVIEDAAQSHGAISEGLRSGSYSDIACFSFYPTKNLGALGDGGAVSTNDKSLALKIRAYANYGSFKSKYNHEIQGLNSRLDSLQAAYLLLFLPFLDDWNLGRKRIANRYRDGIYNSKIQSLSLEIEINDSVWHHFVVRVSDRQDLLLRARSQGINLDVHYPLPLTESALFKDSLGEVQVKTENSFTLASQVVSLPIYPQFQVEKQDLVIDFLNQYS